MNATTAQPRQARRARTPTPGVDTLVRVQDVTRLSLAQIQELLEVPVETARLLQDDTLIDEAGIAELSGRKNPTVRKWRRARESDLAGGLDPDANPNALIAPEPDAPESGARYKRGRILHWLITTLRYDAYEREDVHHNSFGRHVGT